MIVLENLHKSFGPLEVLKGINLTVDKGEVVSLIGASGSGKSTLLYCINALETIDGGKVTVDGVDVHAKGTDINKLRQKLGTVFQQWNSFPHLTALENVALAPRVVSKFSRKDAQEIAAKQLTHVGLGDKLNHYPSQLSGGQQQRLAIAARWRWNRPICCLTRPPRHLTPNLSVKCSTSCGFWPRRA